MSWYVNDVTVSCLVMIGELNLDLPFRAPEEGGGNAVSAAQFEWGTAPGLSRVPCFVQCKCYGSTSGVCNHLATTQFLISHVRSLRRSLDRLSTACKICSFFSCHFLAKRHCWPSVDNVFYFSDYTALQVAYILQHTSFIFACSGKTRVRRRDSERNCPVPRRFNEKPFSHVTSEQ